MCHGRGCSIIDGMVTAEASMSGPAVYRVRVQGHLPLEWADLLMGMNITVSDTGGLRSSTLVGRLADQTALAGLLANLYERQFPILSVECLELG
jgi:hypothetical protein